MYPRDHQRINWKYRAAWKDINRHLNIWGMSQSKMLAYLKWKWLLHAHSIYKAGGISSLFVRYHRTSRCPPCSQAWQTINTDQPIWAVPFAVCSVQSACYVKPKCATFLEFGGINENERPYKLVQKSSLCLAVLQRSSFTAAQCILYIKPFPSLLKGSFILCLAGERGRHERVRTWQLHVLFCSVKEHVCFTCLVFSFSVIGTDCCRAWIVNLVACFTPVKSAWICTFLRRSWNLLTKNGSGCPVSI